MIVLAAVSVAFAQPLAALPSASGADLSGENAIVNVASFAMAHPFRFGELPTMQLARDYLESTLSGLGLAVERQPYLGGVNLVGFVTGTQRPNDWVVVSAHYDSVMTPVSGTGATAYGAWDNGAGVAAALEIARVAAERPWRATVAIALFDDEEGGLVGSREFVTANDGKVRDSAIVRIVANLNMDPPGLNWPCLVDGVHLPVTFYQSHTLGAGQRVLREALLAAKDAEGVPPDAFQFFTGGVQVGILSGNSDNFRFGQRGIPSIYVGSSTHLLAAGQTVRTLYPLHTPADNLGTILAYCPNALTLAEAFEVEMRIVWAGLEAVEAFAGPFPRP